MISQSKRINASHVYSLSTIRMISPLFLLASLSPCGCFPIRSGDRMGRGQWNESRKKIKIKDVPIKKEKINGAPSILFSFFPISLYYSVSSDASSSSALPVIFDRRSLFRFTLWWTISIYDWSLGNIADIKPGTISIWSIHRYWYGLRKKE